MSPASSLIASRESGRLYAWMQAFPPITVERLRKINASTGSASHVVLAIGYGFYDSNIAAINKTIIGLLLKRMQAERCGDQVKIKRIQSVLAGMHIAIDWVTGKSEPYSPVSFDLQKACRSVKREQYAATTTSASAV